MTYDVDEARAQRQEAAGITEWPFKFGGKTWTLMIEIPLPLVDRIEELQASSEASGIKKILEVLLGDQAEAFPWEEFTLQDLLALFEQYEAEAAVSLGESGPSPSSSNRAARRSKQTSKRTTGSTSRTSTAGKSRGGGSKS